jgi:hypothetical protein
MSQEPTSSESSGDVKALAQEGMIEKLNRQLEEIALAALGDKDANPDSPGLPSLVASIVARAETAETILTTIRDGVSRISEGWLAKQPELTRIIFTTILHQTKALTTPSPATVAGRRGRVKDEEPKPKTVVRVTTSAYKTQRGFAWRREVSYQRRLCQGFNVIEDDIGMTGADQVWERIINLFEVKDGLYNLVLCNISTDWETGHVEDWDYQLLPYTPPPTP